MTIENNLMSLIATKLSDLRTNKPLGNNFVTDIMKNYVPVIFH